jgi:hypothetical protein
MRLRTEKHKKEALRKFYPFTPGAHRAELAVEVTAHGGHSGRGRVREVEKYVPRFFERALENGHQDRSPWYECMHQVSAPPGVAGGK